MFITVYLSISQTSFFIISPLRDFFFLPFSLPHSEILIPQIYCVYAPYNMGFPGGSAVKKSAYQCGRHGFNAWIEKIPWRRKWQPSPVFLPEKSRRQRNLAGCRPWGHKRVKHDLATKEQKQLYTIGVSLLYTTNSKTFYPLKSQFLLLKFSISPVKNVWCSSKLGIQLKKKKIRGGGKKKEKKGRKEERKQTTNNVTS